MNVGVKKTEKAFVFSAKCSKCNKRFKDKDKLIRHEKSHRNYSRILAVKIEGIYDRKSKAWLQVNLVASLKRKKNLSLDALGFLFPIQKRQNCAFIVQ